MEFVFYFTDADMHIELMLEPQYQFLASTSPPLLVVSFPSAVLIVATAVLGFGVPYVGISLFRPRKTMLGQLVLGLRSS